MSEPRSDWEPLVGRLGILAAVLVVLAGIFFDKQEIINKVIAGKSLSLDEISVIIKATTFGIICTFLIYFIGWLYRIEQSQDNIKKTVAHNDTLSKLGDAMSKIEHRFGLIENFLSNSAEVEIEGDQTNLWRGFVGEYTAFNPTFAGDVFGGTASHQRAAMHANRYQNGVTRSHYYLYVGTVGKTEIEHRIMSRFCILINAAERSCPDIKDAIQIHLLGGNRPDTSFFFGEKIVSGKREPYGIWYATNDELGLYSSELLPEYIVGTKETARVDRMKGRLSVVLQRAEQETVVTFHAFEAWVKAGFADSLPSQR